MAADDRDSARREGSLSPFKDSSSVDTDLEKVDLDDEEASLRLKPQRRMKVGQDAWWHPIKQLVYSVRVYLISCAILSFMLLVTAGAVASSVNLRSNKQVGQPQPQDHQHHHHPHHDEPSTGMLVEQPTKYTGPLSPEGVPTTCGTTNEEARANDCTFDVMTFAWTPPACWEPDLAEETVSTDGRWSEKHRAGIFGYYTAQNDSISLPQDPEVLSEFAEVWTTRDWHIAHCLYYWRLLGRAVNRSFNDGVDSAYVISQGIVWGHTVHCNDVLAGNDITLAPRLQLYRLYGSCVRINAKPDSELNHGDFFVDPNRLSGAGSGE